MHKCTKIIFYIYKNKLHTLFYKLLDANIIGSMRLI